MLHNTETSYKRGCRCVPCDYGRYSRYLRWRNNPTTLIDSGPTLAHLNALVLKGFSFSVIEAVTGRSPYSVGKHRTYPHQAELFESLTPTNILARCPEHLYVPTTGSVRRIRALQAMGYPLGEMPRTFKRAVTNPHVVICRTHRAVQQAYEELSMKPGPSDLARRKALANGYHPPLAWEDDEIDDPDAIPIGIEER